MNFLYRLFWALCTTSPMLLYLLIRAEMNHWMQIFIILFVLLLPLPSLAMTKSFGKEQMNGCKHTMLCDHEFLPMHFCFWITAYTVNDPALFCFLFVFCLAIVYQSRLEYFHPILLVFGFHFYDVTTKAGTHVRIIKRGKIIRNAKDMCCENLRRLSDHVFIDI